MMMNTNTSPRLAVPNLFLIGLFLVIATTSIHFCYGNLDVVCLESEKLALLSFKHGLEDPSNRLSSWDVELVADCCQWAGVVCNNLTGTVRELHLQTTPLDDNKDYRVTMAEDEAYVKLKLGGEVSPSLLNLKHLSYLDLSRNDFGEIPIPSFLGSLPSLRYLNLSEAGFAGTVPHQLGNLSSLRSLSLKGSRDPYSDELNLDVENVDWLTGLPTLEHLDLSQVNLSKVRNWLHVINKLPSLVELRLSSCGLYRIPPLEKVNFTSLVVLDLSSNGFNTSIPRWIFSLGSLVYLNLGENNFEVQNPIPDGTWNLTSLKVLDVSSINYNFNSSLPSWLFSVKGLVSLNLGFNWFGGPIPSGLQNMTSLRTLDLSWNDFTSSMPNWLYNLRYLELLDLSDNDQLQGTVSSSIENLTSLVTLDLSYTQIKGRVPRAMANLCNLRELYMSGTRIEEDISDLFRSLFGCVSHVLVSLWLGECQLYGHLPEQVEQFNSLEVLYLYGNSISGPIPVSLGRCSSLVAVVLSRNQLSGTPPESLGHLSNLEQIDISHNLLEGVVSEVHFANLTSLRYFYASENRLSLKVSPNWIPPFQLEEISLSSWHLGHQFPMWLHSQKGFRNLDLSCTGISDSIPHWLWNFSSNLMYLNLSHNQIQGELPSILNLDGTSPMIYLGSNQLSGPLPLVSSNVTELDLSNNDFSGDISRFLCDRKDEPNKLQILFLGENHLSGDIPDCWINWPDLVVIELGNNRLSGNIPSSLGYLLGLQSLHLRNNSFSGDIPWSLKNCSDLVTLDIGWNKLVGSIPTWLGTSLSNLRFLDLRSNGFYGEIPSQLCHLKSLQILDLANNSFSGPIPRCFNNFTALTTKLNSSYLRLRFGRDFRSFLESAFVVTKGQELQYDTILPLVTSMDLSDNNISGAIPKELTALLGLLSLNLSGNHLTGVIPKDIGSMGNMESLDFSRNQLSGEIPTSMSALTFLSHFNVSYNNLSGRIPSSTQLQSLDDSSFTGNRLCGRPLPYDCSTDGATLDAGKGGDEEGVESEVDWFYVTTALGFVVGFWGTFGPLIFKKSWRRAYFQFLDEMWNRICICVRRF